MAKSPMDLVKDAKAQIQEISVSDAHAQRSANTVMLDVRETGEYAKDHIEGAVHVSRGMLEFQVEKAASDKDAPVYVYCASGGRSALAAAVLQEMGYSNVASVAGGITAWKDSGLPIEA